MYTLIETTNHHPQYIDLAAALDAELALRDGKAHAFYAPHNTSTHLQAVVLVMQNETAVACGAFKINKPGVAEIKRMYVTPTHRCKGLATSILLRLESICKKQHFNATVLETGINQPEAIALYRKSGYQQIPAFPPYEDAPLSICFMKTF